MRLNGEAVLACRAGETGVLDNCKVVSASKPEFGLAARVMANRKRITAIGSPSTGETINVQVPFVVGAPAAVEP
jgi:hypothetical protein